MKKVAFLNNGSPQSGVGHHAQELSKALQPILSQHDFELDQFLLDGHNRLLQCNGQELQRLGKWPGLLSLKTINWVRLGRVLSKQAANYDLVHATNQTLSFIIPQHKPSIVTVHDLIELLEPQQFLAKGMAHFLYSGITRASHLITVSEYTKKTVQDYYHIPAEKITVIPNGVSSSFYPISDFKNSSAYKTLLQELKLTDTNKIVLYIGSDHIRKNVITAVQAFAKVHQQVPEAIFIKVGEAGIKSGRAALLEEIDRLKIREAVRFVGSVSLDRLNELYNLANVLVSPSKFEGFGLPPLQAMAAGTPVITSNTTSLPEVVGSAGIMHNPEDMEAFAKSMINILTNAALATDLQTKGLEQAKKFSWVRAAEKTAELYTKLI